MSLKAESIVFAQKKVKALLLNQIVWTIHRTHSQNKQQNRHGPLAIVTMLTHFITGNSHDTAKHNKVNASSSDRKESKSLKE